MNRSVKNFVIAVINFVVSLVGVALVVSLCKGNVSFSQALNQPFTWFLAVTGSMASYISLETNTGFRFFGKREV